MKALHDLLGGRNTAIDLDRAALALATVEYPDLDPEPYSRTLDEYSDAIADRASDLDDGRDFVKTANDYLFGEIGLRGNTEDYYDPRNSCLNHVLTAHTGIPITLSVVYMEVARRLAKPVRGVGLPGHFIVKYEDGEYSTYIDPFHGGALLTAEECYNVAGVAAPDPRMLATANSRQILLRMINNLRGIYFSRRDYPKAVQTLDLLIGADPNSAEEYKQRGLIYLKSRRMQPAKADLQRYLKLMPQAPDREEIEKRVQSIARWMAQMN